MAGKSRVPRRQTSDVSSLERRGYRFGKRIGKGSYGSVVAAQFEDENSGSSVELACKYIDKSKAPKDFLEKFFPREIQILTKVSHPNIIGIHSILQSGSTVFIFMRHAENGDLLDYVKKHGALSEAQANLWFFQLVTAIKYIHSMNYAHRDLKCENILISKHMNLKITDFGFARSCIGEHKETIMSETYCGSAGKFASSFCKVSFIQFLFTSLRSAWDCQWNCLWPDEERCLVTRRDSFHRSQWHHAVRRQQHGQADKRSKGATLSHTRRNRWQIVNRLQSSASRSPWTQPETPRRHQPSLRNEVASKACSKSFRMKLHQLF